jgi:hypothetical protein
MIAVIPLLLIVWLVVVLVQRSRRTAGVGGGQEHAARRFVQYAFLLIASFTLATGLAQLVAAALPVDAFAQRRAVGVALGISLTVVAAPIVVLLGRVVRRRLHTDPEERASVAWSLYVVIALSVGLVTAFTQLMAVGRWLIGVDPYVPDQIAQALVWTLFWASHVWIASDARLRPTAPQARLATLFGSAVGLVGLAIGGGGVIAAGLREVQIQTLGPSLIEPDLGLVLGNSLILLGLGGLVWGWHWLRVELDGQPGVLWHTYVVLAGVFGGLLTAVVSGGLALHSVLQWWFGDPFAVTAVAHFDALPSQLAATVVGVGVWSYHRTVLDRRAVRAEPDRVHEYLAGSLGLIAAAAGVTVAIMAFIQEVTPGALASTDASGRNTLIVAATLLLVGAPLWWSFWHRLERRIASGDEAERASPARRITLVLLLGAGSLTAAVSLAVILYVVVRDLLEQELELTVLIDLRAAIGLIVTAATVAGYHASVYRRDRSRLMVEEVVHPRDVLLVGPDGRTLVSAIAASTGARVHGLHRLDLDPATDSGMIDVDRVSAAILAAPFDRVLVTVDADGTVSVVPYEPV